MSKTKEMRKHEQPRDKIPESIYTFYIGRNHSETLARELKSNEHRPSYIASLKNKRVRQYTYK